MTVLVSELLRNLQLALFPRPRDINSLIDAIQKWAVVSSREASLSADTWTGYRHSAAVEAHLPTVLILAEYFYSHPTSKNRSASIFQNICSDMLTVGREGRYQRTAGQDPALRNKEVDRRAGAYAIFRVESEHGNPCQELLLVHPAEGKSRVRFATVVGRNLIVRGHWHLLGSSLHVSGLGFRHGHLPDFLTLSFLEADQIAGGVLSGLGTSRQEPVTMSVVVTKLDLRGNFQKIGDLSDAMLLDKFRKFVPRMMTKRQRTFFDRVHQEVYGTAPVKPDVWLAQKLITSSDAFIRALRGSENFLKMIDPGLRRFCEELI
ncbi:hypothetical protein [uncultured Bradyrhizobium sp.]|uniref:hypothetical protein n=1 Tax=uncultured Bradyrhizobium sp. TaxID=199684 RepID=UPI0035CB11E5